MKSITPTKKIKKIGKLPEKVNYPDLMGSPKNNKEFTAIANRSGATFNQRPIENKSMKFQ